MENTTDNKSKFYAQYWGQKAFTCSHWKNTYEVELYFSTSSWDEFVEGEGDLGWNIDDNHLLLKPLSSIIDEDAIECGRI